MENAPDVPSIVNMLPRKLSHNELVDLAAQRGFTFRKVDGTYTLFNTEGKGQGRFSKYSLIDFLEKRSIVNIEPGVPVSLEGMSIEERDRITLQMMKGAANVAAE